LPFKVDKSLNTQHKVWYVPTTYGDLHMLLLENGQRYKKMLVPKQFYFTRSLLENYDVFCL